MDVFRKRLLIVQCRGYLRQSFRLGLFDNPYVESGRTASVTNSKEHRSVALEAARKAAVLLKNDGGLLPLDERSLKSIAVVGPNAADVHLGGYSWEPRKGITILDGIRERIGKRVDVRYALGCKITDNVPSWMEDEVILAGPAENRRLISEAVKVVKGCDAAILVVGGNESTCREGWMATHLGDRDDLEMLGQQRELVQAVYDTGVPTIVILINGRPLAINWTAEHVPAIIEGWYLGQEAGTAVAEILFGDVNPGGKLPITFPRSVGQIPAYYNHKPTINQNYLFDTKEPLFPFGYGLSYTTFSYSNVKITPERIGTAGKAQVSVDVTNTGDRAGDEVVQMYIRDNVSTVTRPVKELKGFKRITLDPGERTTVTFDLTPKELSFLDVHMERIVEPGEFTVMVGTDSMNYSTATLMVEER